MSDDIYKLIGRLRSYARSSKADIFAAVDTIEALRAERDRLKDEVERLRNEKVAGGVAVCGGDTAGKVESVHSVDLPNSGADIPAPATDPAPAVCEWTDSGGMLWATNCGQSYGAFVSRFGKDAYCPHCDKTIKFSWRPKNE